MGGDLSRAAALKVCPDSPTLDLAHSLCFPPGASPCGIQVGLPCLYAQFLDQRLAVWGPQTLSLVLLGSHSALLG